MEDIYYDVLYLTSCGVNGITPSQRCVKFYIENDEKMVLLYKFCRRHFVEALVGITLEKMGVKLPKEWSQAVSKAVRKVILFDVERAKICSFMEEKGIWYLPLKGIILKDYYPAVGMRQMSDNDILIDEDYAQSIKDYMQSHGYKVESFGFGNHDVYEKEPVYAFEFHRALYSEKYRDTWDKYYRNIKEKLILNEGTSFGYHMSDEDFYIYIVCHAYKHYKEGGTGIRSLLDFYVYLSDKEEQMDFKYIDMECKKLEIDVFEKMSRNICKKIFLPENDEAQDKICDYDKSKLLQKLTKDEYEMLTYYISSGVYGTLEHMIDNNMKKYKKAGGKVATGKYLFRRIFPDMEVYRLYFPFFYKHKWLLPAGWFYRFIRVIFVGRHRSKMMREIKIVRKG